MADFAEVFTLVFLAISICVGTTLNLLTIYVLFRNKTLRKQLASVYWLMIGQALSEVIECGIGLPIELANELVGLAPPFTTVAFICHCGEYLIYGPGNVALWYQTIIALTRLAAVTAPNWSRQHEQKRFVSIGLWLFPWLIGYILYAVGALTHAYYIRPTPGRTVTTIANRSESFYLYM